MPAWFKTTLKIIAAVIVLILIIIIGTFLYITTHKTKVLALINTELNKNLDGKLVIGGLEPTLFKGFPGVSVSLNNVLLQDKQWARHHHTLLSAADIDVSVNALALLKGTVSINNIFINNASVDLYTDSTGYSNTSVFKKSKTVKADETSKSSSATEFGKFNLNNVNFTVDDQKAKKLFQFDIHELKGKMDYPDSGWRADIHLNLMAKSMAFSTLNGSFIKNKSVEADLTGGYNEQSGKITAHADDFNIDDNHFVLNALFNTGKKPADFSFHLADKSIMWHQASGLLSANITKPLNQFNTSKPIAVTAIISGSFGGGNPFLYITAAIRHNDITIPGATVQDCSLDGIFTNIYVKAKGTTDSNSVIKFSNLTGKFNGIPLTVDTGSIINLEKPYALGNVHASFPAADLNDLLGGKVARFGAGNVDLNLHYKTDIVAYKLNKPIVKGVITLKNTDISYVPRHLVLKNTSLSLNFTGNDLFLNNIHIQTGRSVVMMQGRINNFLNLYYNAPEKILLTWQIRSPQLYLGEFLGFLSSRQRTETKIKANTGNVVDQLNNVLDKGRAEMHIQVAQLHYFKFLATNVNADLLLSEDGVQVNNVSLNNAGGSVKMNGQLIQGTSLNRFTMSAVVTNVNIQQFFYSFDNFGLKAVTSQNLRGYLSAKAQIGGELTDAGGLAANSMNGSVSINLKNGALLNYAPIKSVGKFAFPFRDLSNIQIPNLDGKFDIHGDKITINPMEISSSVLNMDVAGTYGLNKGTDIALDVPLRDPKKDDKITDKAELAKRRDKGIVLHILAKDDETGKLKIGWNKNHK